MKYVSIYIALFLLLVLTGCNNKDKVQNFAIDVVLVGPPPADDKSTLYPQDLKLLVQPIENAGTPKTNIALYPLTLKRVDIGQSQAMDYESNHATNFKKIKAVERGWKTFFENSMPPKWLFSTQKADFHLKAYLNQNKSPGNIFLLSEEPQTIANVQTFNNIQDLRTALAEFASNPDKKTSKAIIIYKPVAGISTAEADSLQAKKQDSTAATAESTAVATPKENPVPIESSAAGATRTKPVFIEPAPSQTVISNSHVAISANLQQNMQQLTGGSLNAEEKEVLKQSILKKFAPDAKVFLVKGGQVTSTKAIQRYLESLIVTERNINRAITIDSVKKFEDAKIYDIYIHETAAEIQ